MKILHQQETCGLNQPELVEGLLTMGKLQADGDLVRGVQRP